jgi:diguanylate cyclase (GGDEF)-like protein/PAS domain S-box-containing protein
MPSSADDFSTLFELLPIGAYRSAPNGKQLRANRALYRLNGYGSESEMLAAVRDIGQGWYVDENRRAEFKKLLETDGVVLQFVSEIFRHKTRERIWISENAHVVYHSDGTVAYYEGTVEDITPRRTAEVGLQLSVGRFEALTSKSQSASVICDLDGRASFCTTAIESLLGVSRQDFVGMNIFDTMHPDDQVEHRAEFARVALHRNTGEESVARHRHADGSWRYLASFASDARDDPSVRGMIVYWRDVTETHIARLRLRQIAETDALTGLFTRAHFERASVSVLESQQVDAAQIALYFIDLDNFKLANDSYGHWIGDQILVIVARRLQALCGDGDLLARLGGDEFAILSTSASQQKRSSEFARRIVETVCEPIQIDTLGFDITASVGVATFPDDTTKFTELLRFADLAMFAAKAESRNTYVLFTPELEQRARRHSVLIGELKRALSTDQFVVYYQPQIDMASGQLIGVEALVRWNHPTRGLVEPGEFIGVAEEQGLINRIGICVLEQSVAQIAQWRRATGRALRLAINVSAQQLRDRSLGARLFELLGQHGLPADAIEVEVTESILVEATRAGRDLLYELRHLGVRIVLDDLGVGYSSMTYLRQFPVDGVKLDRGFVEGLPDNPVDAAIVRSIISLARELNLTLVAEGVERVEQRSFLLSEKCEAGQGYLFAKPLSPTAFEDGGWLAR